MCYEASMPEISQILTDHIQKHWSSILCPLCGTNDWRMNGPFGLVPASIDARGCVTGYRTRAMGSPVMALVCGACGHTSLIDYSVLIGREP